MTERLDRLKSANYPVQYAVPADAFDRGWLRWYDITDYPGEGDLPFVVCRDASDDDNHAGFIDQSNHRSLVRDFGGALVHVNSELGFFVHSAPDELIDAVIGLRDYAVYDESDWSELESDAITESWGQYLRSDVYRTLPEWTQELWDRAEGLSTDPNALRDAFYSALHDAEYYPECSDNEVLWDYDRCAEIMTDVVRNTVRASLGRPPLAA
jgi:hypothetical protein